MKSKLVGILRTCWASATRGRLPDPVKMQVRIDRRGLPSFVPEPNSVIQASMKWLCRAQDQSPSLDGGVARSYSLRTGWATSYPETTGYIIPTFLTMAAKTGDAEFRARARRMLDWLKLIQMPSGAFQGGKIDSRPVVPVCFNTGQILLGLAAGQREFGAYGESMRRAADWLVQAQDPDGCWRKFQTPFAAAGEKTYETHTAWGLLEAARLEPNRGYADAALANVRWALSHQSSNGWFDKCCLSDASKPLTHTIGYALRGVLEAYRYSGDPPLLESARRTADGVMTALQDDGFLPGMLSRDWSGAVSWACLTGTAQIALCWLILYTETGDSRYLEAASVANRYVCRTVLVQGPEDVRGGVRGSFPVDGDYAPYEYLSWGAKFLVDALLMEQGARQGKRRDDG